MKKALTIISMSLVLTSCVHTPSKDHEQEERNDQQRYPTRTGHVNDLAMVMSQEEVKLLENKLDSFQRHSSKEIVVLSINSDTLNTNNFFQYAVAIANYWRVGGRESGEGIIIVFSTNIRQVRLATSYATEKVLTDAICKHVIEDAIVPAFKNKKYYEGLDEATDQIIRSWR